MANLSNYSATAGKCGRHGASPKGRLEVVARVKGVLDPCGGRAVPSASAADLFDEKAPSTSFSEVRLDRARHDDEDRRNGTANLFDERTRINWMFTTETGRTN